MALKTVTWTLYFTTRCTLRLPVRVTLRNGKNGRLGLLRLENFMMSIFLRLQVVAGEGFRPACQFQKGHIRRLQIIHGSAPNVGKQDKRSSCGQMLQVPDPGGKCGVACLSTLQLGFQIPYSSAELPILHLLGLQFLLMSLSDGLLEVTPDLLQAIYRCIKGAQSWS